MLNMLYILYKITKTTVGGFVILILFILCADNQ
jgi:hypothetical protein